VELRPKGGTPITPASSLDDKRIERVRALSIGTVEELLSLIYANPKAFAQFVELSDVAKLQADLAQNANAAILSRDRAAQRPYKLGAFLPPGIEQVASLDRFERYADMFGELGPEGAGRDNSGCMGPVRNQGDRGTCVAHAGCAVAECLRKQATAEVIDYSEQFLYWNCKTHDGSAEEEGTWLRVAMPTLVSDGVSFERTWPYNPTKTPGNESQGPPPDPAIVEALTQRFSGVLPVSPTSSTDMRDLLDRSVPIAVSIPVYENWIQAPAVQATGLVPMPEPFARLEGGHAICLAGYGYDTSFTGGGAFIFRNSWGVEWAEASPFQPGYGVLPFAYIDEFGVEAFSLSV